MHEHVIGEIIGYEDTRLVTLKDLQTHIQHRHDLAELFTSEKAVTMGVSRTIRVYTLSDYCDGRRVTDLRRFNFCPYCGQAIDWKHIKEVAT